MLGSYLILVGLISGAPLLIAAVAWIALAHPELNLQLSLAAVASVVAILGVIQISAVCAVSAVYRWCFHAPSVRGAWLLASLLALVLSLSHAPLLTLFAEILRDAITADKLAGVIMTLLTEAVTLVGVTVAVCLLLTVLLELPLRWAAGSALELEDGLFRLGRCLGVLVFGVLSLTVAKEEGVIRLANILRNAFN
jgi:hypothetical protein